MFLHFVRLALAAWAVLDAGIALAAIPPVAFEGLDKTAPDYAQQLYATCHAGKPTLTPADLKQCLLNSKHFADVKVSQDGGGNRVKVEERLTMLVLPQIQSERAGSVKWGLYFLDSHLMGRGILGVLGLAKGKFTESAFLFINHKKRRYPFVVYAGYTRDELVLFDGEDEVDGVSETRRTGKVMLGTHLSPRSTLYGAVFAQSRGYSELKPYLPAQAVEVQQLGVEWVYRDQHYKLFFDEGLRVKTKLYGSVHQSEDGEKLGADGGQVGNGGQKALSPVSTLEAELGWGYGVWRDHALTINAFAGKVNDGVATDGLRLGYSAGFRGVPNSGIWAESYATLALDYHVPVRRSGFGTVTVAPFMDAGFAVNRLRQRNADGFETKRVDFTSYGLGAYLFLNQVAIPGVGLIYGQNKEYGGSFFSFSIGVSN